MKSEAEIKYALECYADMIRRICFVYLKNEHDCEDVFQEVFIKYATNQKRFTNQEHEKAWMIRVSINRCKDLVKRSYKKDRPLDEVYAMTKEAGEQQEVLMAVGGLPENYRTVVYLHYYEGYTAPQIGKLIHKNTNTVYTWLGRAKEALKEKLGGEASV